MNPETMQLISGSGGRFNLYSQGDYIIGNNWGDPNNTLRQGAWIGNSYSRKTKVVTYGLAGGVCLGLSCAYLVAGANWGKFEEYLKGQAGRSLVRGIMNYQELLYANKNARLANMVTNRILKTYNVNFLKKTKVLRAHVSRRVGEEILRNITHGFVYCIRIYIREGGHAIPIRIDPGYIKLFDPNFGEVIYFYQSGSSQGMARFLTHLLSEYYAPIESVYVERYSLS